MRAKDIRANAAAAQRLAKDVWDSRAKKPVAGFIAVRLRIEESLDAGWTEADIVAVLPSMTFFSRNAFDIALAGKRPQGVVTLRNLPNEETGYEGFAGFAGNFGAGDQDG